MYFIYCLPYKAFFLFCDFPVMHDLFQAVLLYILMSLNAFPLIYQFDPQSSLSPVDLFFSV